MYRPWKMLLVSVLVLLFAPPLRAADDSEKYDQSKVPLENTLGPRESRGATVSGSQVHSIRLPGHTIALEVIFGREDERLSIKYEGGVGAGPYIAGTLTAIRRVRDFTGMVRGLDGIL